MTIFYPPPPMPPLSISLCFCPFLTSTCRSQTFLTSQRVDLHAAMLHTAACCMQCAFTFCLPFITLNKIKKAGDYHRRNSAQDEWIVKLSAQSKNRYANYFYIKFRWYYRYIVYFFLFGKDRKIKYPQTFPLATIKVRGTTYAWNDHQLLGGLST